MEQVKNPIAVLTIINTVGTAGATLYLYKENQELKRRLRQLEDAVIGMTKNFGLFEKTINSQGEQVKLLTRDVNKLTDIQTDTQEHYEELTEALTAKELVKISDLPSQSKRKRKKSRKPRKAPNDSDSDSDNEEDDDAMIKMSRRAN